MNDLHVVRRGDDLEVALWYPPMKASDPALPHSNGRAIQIDLVHVRASDGIRVFYDFDRDGWVIQQPKRLCWEADENPDPQWTEVAFAQSWALSEDDE